MKTEEELFQTEVMPGLVSARKNASPIYTLHHAWNYPLVTGLMAERDMNIEHNPPGSKGPALVTASGPSLDYVIPYMNKIRKSHGGLKIWAGNTQLWALYYKGVVPDYVVKHDPWPRRCPECNGFGHYNEGTGDYECLADPAHLGFDRLDIQRRTQLHRDAPEVDTIPVMHPGVHRENFMWKTMQKQGQLFLTDTNPSIKIDEKRSIGTRELARGNSLERLFAEYVASDPPSIKGEAGRQALGELMNQACLMPDIFAPQDMIEHVSRYLYGEVNPVLKYPITNHVAYSPSTAMMSAMLAYYHGHDPIYFAGYDLGHWNNLGRHNEFYHDGTDRPATVSNGKGAKSNMGWIIDATQAGEKYTLLAYLSKRFAENFVRPGFRCVEIVVDGKPGNLELIPRIGVKELAKGGSRDIPQKETAAKIRAAGRARGVYG